MIAYANREPLSELPGRPLSAYVAVCFRFLRDIVQDIYMAINNLAVLIICCVANELLSAWIRAVIGLPPWVLKTILLATATVKIMKNVQYGDLPAPALLGQLFLLVMMGIVMRWG